MSQISSCDVWTPGPNSLIWITWRFKSLVVLLNGMRWFTSFKLFSQLMIMNGGLRSIPIHIWLFENLNLKKISMRGNYFSRTLWKLSFTYVMRGNYFPQATQPMHPNYFNYVFGIVCVNICDVWNNHWISWVIIPRI